MKYTHILVLPLFCTLAAAGDIPKEPAPPVAKCVAHRGFSSVAPENTLVAMKMAMEAGTNGAEMDVYISRDGVPFLFHDAKMKRTAGVDAPLTACDAEFIRTLDAGAWKADKYRGERIPTLTAALELLKDTPCRPVIEMKDGKNLVEITLAEIKKAGLLETAVVIDFNAANIKKLKQLAPEVCAAWLCSKGKDETEQAYIQRIISILKDCRTNVVDMNYQGVTPGLVKALNAEGITVWCWTVNKPEDMRRMLDAGVVSITTDCPDVLLKELEDGKKFPKE